MVSCLESSNKNDFTHHNYGHHTKIIVRWLLSHSMQSTILKGIIALFYREYYRKTNLYAWFWKFNEIEINREHRTIENVSFDFSLV